MRSYHNFVSRGVIFLLAAFAIASWVATLVVFRLAKRYYTEANATRLDPLGLQQLDIPANPGQPTLVFYGDSRAAQWPEPSGFAGKTLNLGVGNQTTEQVLLRFNYHLGQIRPRIVVIQVGINDLKAIPLFPQSEGRIVETCKQNIGKIVSLCRERGAHVVVTTIFPVGKLPIERRMVWSDRVAPAIDEVNRHILSLASADVSVFNSSSVLTGKDGNLISAYSRDFLHLADTGYGRLNEKLREQMDSVLKPATTTSH
jgi:lysophospholipase L1-like esterase